MERAVLEQPLARKQPRSTWSSIARPFLVFTFLLLGLLSACSLNDPVSNRDRIPDTDFVAPEGWEFNSGKLVEDGEFEDATFLDEEGIRKFLENTPYGSRSCLSEYSQRGGEFAAAGIAKAASDFKINPLVFLVHAQLAGQLISESNYPKDSFRAEFTFGCGCNRQDACDNEQAGFNQQVACLGQHFRDILDFIKDNSATETGWAVGEPKTSYDGVAVTPENDATAAMYEYFPEVGEKKGGNWMFALLWVKYKEALAL